MEGKGAAARPRAGAAKPAEAGDPMELKGVPVPEGDLEAMGEAFVEEFARLGLGEDEIYMLFARPRYFGTHLYFERYGAARTRDLIRRVASRTGVYRYREEESCDA